MKDGFIKAAAVVPPLKVADVEYNTQQILIGLQAALEGGAKIIAFPELAVTGYTCQDLFLQDILLEEAEKAVAQIAAGTAGSDAVVLVGAPLRWDGKLYNTAAVIQNGRVLAFVPKLFMPNYAEFYELRQFTPGPQDAVEIRFRGESVPLGSRILLDVDAVREMVIGCEICEDAWVMNSPDIDHAMAGANVIVNLSASNETVGKDEYRTSLFMATSARTITDYIYVSAGDGESTQDIVFGGRVMMIENGAMLAQRGIFDNEYGAMKLVFADFDIARMNYERRRMTTFFSAQPADYLHIKVHMETQDTKLERVFDPHPFVPSNTERRTQRCEDIFHIQTRGLAKRLQHTGCKRAVLGLSGGLDSTLALMVTVRAFDLLGIPRENILAVTMPCFGTTDRTYHNACVLARTTGATLREINIRESVNQHFADIGQDPDNHDVTYENSQARERTQILMDLANQFGGMVIGTGDLSELALGWATYNGDHMSMYAVNAGVPKTLVSHLVQFTAQLQADLAATLEDPEDAKRAGDLSAALYDVLDTPVSPELLPPTENGTISQKTEDLVGPYELHDFFLYYMLRCGYPPA